ncbi:hypothetical protein BI065_gp11 [Weissella phage WCP30]|uniref:hypothetical protein n=1 Tax=Weissella phage WCP30 TaxID=1837862 RepID=UPI000811006F|nr:hypothetical protein BI065_gp11 [Weissella phage WCP30]ANU78885.1 hypothetical protein [Weissella phage WCP30]
MAKRYKVTQYFMEELNDWKERTGLSQKMDIQQISYLDAGELSQIPESILLWRVDSKLDVKEKNERLIAIIKWLNGEDVFEVEKKQWVVRSKTSNNLLKYLHLHFFEKGGVKTPVYDMYWGNVEKFDNREEAEKWVVPGFEVVEF